MSGYECNDARYGTHSLIGEEIGVDKVVLDIGCNRGYLKRCAPSNVFFGIDSNEDALREAKNTFAYQEVFNVDLNEYHKFLSPRKFDVIIFGDVLEHVLDPQAVLDHFTASLNDDGFLIISLPNVAHVSIRLALLFGSFDYTESGILDKSHLHLYTRRSARALIAASGFTIVKEKFSSNHFGIIARLCPPLGPLIGYNLIFVCRKGS